MEGHKLEWTRARLQPRRECRGANGLSLLGVVVAFVGERASPHQQQDGKDARA